MQSAFSADAYCTAACKGTAADWGLPGCAQVELLVQEMGTIVNDTRANVEKKQALTYEELQAEAAEAEVEAGPSDSDDEDDFVYNPLKLPLGYDGKPIPFWLYKLHGLNQVRGTAVWQADVCWQHKMPGQLDASASDKTTSSRSSSTSPAE